MPNVLFFFFAGLELKRHALEHKMIQWDGMKNCTMNEMWIKRYEMRIETHTHKDTAVTNFDQSNVWLDHRPMSRSAPGLVTDMWGFCIIYIYIYIYIYIPIYIYISA